MKIPLYTKKPRFYLAVSPHKALSSFDSIFEAVAAYKKLNEQYGKEPHYYREFKKVIGIMVVEGFDRRLYEIPLSQMQQ